MKNLTLKITYLLLCVTLPAIIKAQAQTGTSPAFRGSFFALSVANLEASTRWYSEKLGLKIVMQVPMQNKTGVTVLEGNGLIVELIQNDDALPPEKFTPAIKHNILMHGIFKVGVMVDDLDKMIAMFKERGVEIFMGPFPSRADQRSNVLIKDNSGNIIQFFGK